MQSFALNFLNGRRLRETRFLKIFDLTQLNWRIRFASIPMMWTYHTAKKVQKQFINKSFMQYNFHFILRNIDS